MNRIGLVLILMTGLAAGCKKKPVETVADSVPPPPVAPSPKPLASSKSGNAPILGGGGAPTSSPGIVSAGSSGGGSGGAAQAVRKAARREKAQSELDQLALTIEQLRDPNGQMPRKEAIMADLQKSAPTLFNAIQDGSYILTGTKEPSGLWAYEVDSDKQPGLAVIAGRAQRTNPDDVKRYLNTMN